MYVFGVINQPYTHAHLPSSTLQMAQEDTPVNFLLYLKKQGVELTIPIRKAFLLGVGFVSTLHTSSQNKGPTDRAYTYTNSYSPHVRYLRA